MRSVASILALLALAAALTIGASAQQQTFSTAHAGPTGPVPIITGQPVNGDVYPYGTFPCNGQMPRNRNPKAGTMPAKGTSGRRNPCGGGGGSRPSGRPRPTQHPYPRPS